MSGVLPLNRFAYLEDKRAAAVIAEALSGDVPAVRAAAAAAMSHLENIFCRHALD